MTHTCSALAKVAQSQTWRLTLYNYDHISKISFLEDFSAQIPLTYTLCQKVPVRNVTSFMNSAVTMCRNPPATYPDNASVTQSILNLYLHREGLPSVYFLSTSLCFIFLVTHNKTTVTYDLQLSKFDWDFVLCIRPMQGWKKYKKTIYIAEVNNFGVNINNFVFYLQKMS